MPETDVTKMKVADLKRELKLRGLAITGNKNELQDRLQTALLDGDISLEDTAISSEDALLEEDAVLTDEDEAKILGADENELLQSPIATPTASELTSPMDTKSTGGDDAASSSSAPIPPKKIILKRKNSFTSSISSAVAEGSSEATTKENTEPPKEKVLKMSQRNPITIGDVTASSSGSDGDKKVAQLSQKERLELRAKKFGLNANITTNNSTTDNKITATSSIAYTPAAAGDPKQIEMLKKRAERFGCVVSSKMAKIDAEEKLLKRKERFGAADPKSTSTAAAPLTTTTTASKGSDVWAEKARARLERFKTTSTVTPAATKITIATGGTNTATTSAAAANTNPTAVASN